MPHARRGHPGAGATIAALEHITGRKLELFRRQALRLIMDVALSRLDLPPERCLMVGDRLETDMFMGQQAGMKTAAVLSGASTRADVARMERPPDFVLENIGEIPRVLHDLL